MDEGRRLERLARLLLRKLLRRQLAQLMVDVWQQLLRGLRIALLDGREDSCYVIHRQTVPRPIPPDDVGQP